MRKFIISLAIAATVFVSLFYAVPTHGESKSANDVEGETAGSMGANSATAEDWRYDLGMPSDSGRNARGEEIAIVPAAGTKVPPASASERTASLLFEAGLGTLSYTGDIGRATETGTQWFIRGAWGLHSLFGAELAYIGSSNPMAYNSRFGGSGLVTHGAEALLRIGLAEDESLVIPFLAAGISYQSFHSPAADLGGRHRFGVPLAGGMHILTGERLTLGARVGYSIGTGLAGDAILQGNSWSTALTLGASF